MSQKERRKFPRIATDNLHSTIKFMEGDTQSFFSDRVPYSQH